MDSFNPFLKFIKFIEIVVENILRLLQHFYTVEMIIIRLYDFCKSFN